MKNRLILLTLLCGLLFACDKDNDEFVERENQLTQLDLTESELKEKLDKLKADRESQLDGKSVTVGAGTPNALTYHAGYGFDPLAKDVNGNTVTQFAFPVFKGTEDILSYPAQGVSFRKVDIIENYDGAITYFSRTDTLSLSIAEQVVPAAKPAKEQKTKPKTTKTEGTIPEGKNENGQTPAKPNAKPGSPTPPANAPGIQSNLFSFDIQFRNKVLKDLRINDTTVTLLATVKVYDQSYSLPGIKIKPPLNPFDPTDTGNIDPTAKQIFNYALSAPNGPEVAIPYFVDLYGPLFASGVIKGGEVVYKMEFSSKNMTDVERREYALKLKLGIGALFNFSFGQEVIEFTKKELRKKSTKVEVYTNIGQYVPPNIKPETAVEDLFQVQTGLVNHLAANPNHAGVFSIIAGDYGNFLDMYQIFNATPGTNPFADQQAQKVDFLLREAYEKQIKCYADWDAWKALEGTALSVIEFSTDQTKKQAAQNALNEIRANIANSRDNCAGSNTPNRANYASWL